MVSSPFRGREMSTNAGLPCTQVVLNTYGAVTKTLMQQGAAFQSRPEFELWHGTFRQAVDSTTTTTLGSKLFVRLYLNCALLN